MIAKKPKEVDVILEISPSGTLNSLKLAESSTVENGKLNGHANGSAAGGPAEAEVDPGTDATKHTFLSAEQGEKGQAKASVIEVFKKV